MRCERWGGNWGLGRVRLHLNAVECGGVRARVAGERRGRGGALVSYLGLGTDTGCRLLCGHLRVQ